MGLAGEGMVLRKRTLARPGLVSNCREAHKLDNEDGHPFPSLAVFAAAKIPFGLGYDPDVILHIQEETRDILLGEKVAEVQALRAKAGNPCPSRHNQYTPEEQLANSDNIRISSPAKSGGTSSAYLLARIKRDAPDIFEAVEHGEYRSARAAAKAAGIIHEPTPLDYLHRYWRKVSPEDRLRFLIDMLTPNERRALVLRREARTASGRADGGVGTGLRWKALCMRKWWC
jgi:hypothetical protein